MSGMLRKFLCLCGLHGGDVLSAQELDVDTGGMSAFVCDHCDYIETKSPVGGISFVHQQPPAEYVINMEIRQAEAVLEDLEKMDAQQEVYDETEAIKMWLQKEVPR